MFSFPQNAFCFTNLFCLVLEIFRFFKNHAQNLNTPQNNLASWDLQMGFNSAFKGLTGKCSALSRLLLRWMSELAGELSAFSEFSSAIVDSQHTQPPALGRYCTLSTLLQTVYCAGLPTADTHP